MIFFYLYTLILILATATAHPVAVVAAAQACNGHTELCSRKYSEVSLVGTHDSAFVGDLPQDNQAVSVPDQLNAGIRFLQAQTHKDPLGTLSMCHTSCYLLDAGSLETYLTTIKTWLDANPNEVLTLLLTNGDNVDVSMFDSAFTSSGLKDDVFVPSSSPSVLAMDAWPTLQSIISSKKRLVLFLDYGADMTKYPYILDEFSYFFETPFDTTDPAFPQCSLDRPAGAKPDGRMYIVNHFLDLDIFGVDIPDRGADAATNAATGTGSIGSQDDLCASQYGRKPNFVLVDNFDTGDVFTAQKTLNGL
ncbi:MAG: hypothetical protein M4579_006819 [Chaenotheca gracillima]|nr:MAG: hypothetical protein M4579_006819 [Chaenotheca gracillima]